MNKLISILLFAVATILPQGTVPTTVLEIFGKDATNAAFHVDQYLGPSYTVTGNINPNDEPGCIEDYWTSGRSDSITFTGGPVSNITGNYLAIIIGSPNGGGYSANTWSLNFFNFAYGTAEGHFLFSAVEQADGTDQLIARYGNSAYNTFTVNIDQELGENLDSVHIFVLLTEADSLTIYVDGIYQGSTTGWEPTILGKTGGSRRLGGSPSTDYAHKFDHVSIHRVLPGETFNRSWINNYIQDIITRFSSCTDIDQSLRWTPLQEGYGITYPDATEIYWQTDDTVTVTWTDDVGNDITNVWLTTNNRTTYTLLGQATGGATSFKYAVGDIVSNQCRILISDPDSNWYDESESLFTIVDNYLRIYYPDNAPNQTFEVGDTVHVGVESALISTFNIYWSPDSLNWELMDEVIIDTTNNHIIDTTTYIWSFTHGEVGPIIYLKVSQTGDTALYYFERSYTEIGWSAPVGLNNCQTYEGGNVIEKQVKYDVSCGWANPPIRYYNRWITADAQGFSQDYVVDPDPVTYPRLTPTYLIDGVDTNAVAIGEFYMRGISITYSGRTYYVHNKKLYSDDNVNDIDSILVCDLSPLYSDTFPWDENENVYIIAYNVRWDSISNHYLPIDTTFENLNNDLIFKPLLVLEHQPSLLIFQNVIVEALPFPNPQDPAEDAILAFSGASTFRYHFRGIHPKAEKR